MIWQQPKFTINMNNFKYSLDENGNVSACGYGDFDYYLDGSELFTGFDISDWRKDITTGEWIYSPPKPIWHEEDKKIQIILTHQANTKLVSDVPELAMYRKQNAIKSYTDENNVYVYADWLLPEHRQLLTAYGAIINEV